MSTIQYRIYEDTAPLDRNMLLDIFHLGNLRLSKRKKSNGDDWYNDKDHNIEIVQDYYKPIEAHEVLSEYVEDKNHSDGFIVYLNIDDKPRSFKKANLWLNDILNSHIELITEMGWKSEIFLGKNPQKWVSKKLIKHTQRLGIPIKYMDNENQVQELLLP
ncbi:MAG: hypothetical protein KDD94_06120 [Calditrichaeota bacterium]|nr:hypothetical protein [Calditrichota bacterium]